MCFPPAAGGAACCPTCAGRCCAAGVTPGRADHPPRQALQPSRAVDRHRARRAADRVRAVDLDPELLGAGPGDALRGIDRSSPSTCSPSGSSTGWPIRRRSSTTCCSRMSRAACYLGLLCFSQGRDAGDRLDGVGGPGIDDANALGMYLATGMWWPASCWPLTQTGLAPLACAARACRDAQRLRPDRQPGRVPGPAGRLRWCCTSLRPRGAGWVFWAPRPGRAALRGTADRRDVHRPHVHDQSRPSRTEEPDSSARSRVVIVQAQLQMFSGYPMGLGRRGTASAEPGLHGRPVADRGARTAHGRRTTPS